LNKSCNWWIIHSEICFIVDRPSVLCFENGRLHCENGPAIKWRDGWELWFLEGVQVTRKIVLEPEKLELEEIENESNLEVRRLMIQRFGPSRYMLESGAECIDFSAGLGLLGSAPRALYKTSKGEKWLVGSDGSTKRIYWMAVPEQTETCSQAHCAISGMDSENRLLAEA
jgi:hypothetical protein